MNRKVSRIVTYVALIALLPGAGFATTREIAELQPARLTFGQSILSQLTNGTYRDPFDELQTRPYNLLFNNIGRHANTSPWPGQEGGYGQYFNALIGNNGTANVDNDADSIQGAWIRRETDRIAWGLSGAFLAGTGGSTDTNATTTFADADDLNGYDLRGAAAFAVSDTNVIGAGIQVTLAESDVSDSTFETGVGGLFGGEEFSQMGISVDVGLRHFVSEKSSWEVQALIGQGTSEQFEFSENFDDTGALTDRFVIQNYEISDFTIGLFGGYNRLKSDKLGESQFRVGIERATRELDNPDLSFNESVGVVTPNLTLLGQDAIETMRVSGSARSIFQAGQTEMFAGVLLGYVTTSGSTSIDANGITVNEEIDDTSMELSLNVGLRQPVYKDLLRIIVSGRGDLLDQERSTMFDTSTDIDNMTNSTAQYAIGLEGVLANVTFDLAWLFGEEAPTTPVGLGLPSGSRRSVESDRLVFSAGVSW